MSLTAYNINKDGVLVYAGLPTNYDGKDIEFEHHNGAPFDPTSTNTQYEVWGTNGKHLVHGRIGLTEEEKGRYVKIDNVWRLIGK